MSERARWGSWGCRARAQGLTWLCAAGAGTWSGAFQCWGMQHKESPICVCCNAKRVTNNVEYKPMDATANPYIALAAIITAGLLVRALALAPQCCAACCCPGGCSAAIAFALSSSCPTVSM